MSQKKPSDSFTRFTSTAPPTNPQPSTSPSSKPSSTETPAERVARLRAAHRLRTTQSKLSPVDKLISRGRTFADLAHRVTTYSLLAITGVSTVIAVYGLISLVSHNRRQKRAWIEREMDRLAEAQRAFLRGEADAEQLHLLEQERAGEEIAKKFAEEKKRRKEEGVWGGVKGTFGSWAGQGDMGVESARKVEDGRREEGEVRSVVVKEGSVAGVGLDEKGRPVPIGKVERGRKEEVRGGPLDVLAGNVASTWQGWWSWVVGGGKSSSASSS